MHWPVTALRNWKHIKAQIEDFISMPISTIIQYSSHELQGTSRNKETEAMSHIVRNLFAVE